MQRVRVRFSKTGSASFISHADLPMIFARAARRAGLVPEMTAGFTPRARLALGPPLPIGVDGLSEPADFWFEPFEDAQLDAWRSCMPRGIEIRSIARIAEGISLSKLCLSAEYDLRALNGTSPSEIASCLGEWLRSDGALLSLEADGESCAISVGEIERCGAPKFVARLAEAGLIEGWTQIRITRTSVTVKDPAP